MDVREKLVEIIQNSVGGCARHWAEVVADGLIANEATVQEWIPANEPPKENCKQVLIALRWDDTDIGWYDKEDKCWRSEYVNCYDVGDIKHWQYLPQPPKGE